MNFDPDVQRDLHYFPESFPTGRRYHPGKGSVIDPKPVDPDWNKRFRQAVISNWLQLHGGNGD